MTKITGQQIISLIVDNMGRIGCKYLNKGFSIVKKEKTSKRSRRRFNSIRPVRLMNKERGGQMRLLR